MKLTNTLNKNLDKRTKNVKKTKGRAQYRTHEKHREDTEMAEPSFQQLEITNREQKKYIFACEINSELHRLSFHWAD